MRNLDERGVPGVMIATTVFERAAVVQSASLGFEPAIVFVPHPIQNRTDAEIQAVADEALKAILGAMTAE